MGIFGRSPARQERDAKTVAMDLERVNKELILEARRGSRSASYYGSGSGGYGSRFGHLTGGQKSPGGLSRNGMTRVFDHCKIRRNARDAMFDSVEGRAIATRFADTIVDSGVKIKLEPNIEALGISADQAEEWSRINSSRFNLWLGSKDCTLDGNNNGYQNQWLYAFSQQRDNDMFIRLHYSGDSELMNPVQMQFIDPDQINGYAYTTTYGLQYTSTLGIEYDAKGREQAYNVQVRDPATGQYKTVKVPRKSASGRVMMLHGFRVEYAGQKQGYPLYTHLLQELENITDLKQAHLQKAINQSSFGFYTKPSKDAPASGAGVSDLANESAEVIADFLGADEIDGMTSEEQAAFAANILPEFTIRQPGSLWHAALAGGEDMRAVDQTAPADKFAEFSDNLISYLSASTGMPIEVLLMKFGENYSASRASLVLLWRVVGMWKAEMASDFLNPLFQMWLAEEIAAGRTQAPGWQDPRLRAAWCNCRWIGSPVPSIDPKKEADAAGLRSNMGHLTLADGALEFNGSDVEANMAKLRKEIPGLAIGPWAQNWQHREGAESEGTDTDMVDDDDDE